MYRQDQEDLNCVSWLDDRPRKKVAQMSVGAINSAPALAA